MRFPVPISIEKINVKTENWEPFIPKLYSKINKSMRDHEFLNAGAVQSKRSLIFEIRYRPNFEIAHEIQLYRIIYRGVPYHIVDYDDFKERHRTIKLLGVHV